MCENPEVVQKPWLWCIPMWEQHWEGCCCGTFFHCTPSSRRAEGTEEPWPAPVLSSTFPSLPKDKQDGWCSLLQSDASFSSHPPNLLIPLIIHMTEEQPSESWQQLLHSSLHPWMGSVISRRGAWVLEGQRRWEAGVSRKSPLCYIHAGMDLPRAGQYHTGCLTSGQYTQGV